MKPIRVLLADDHASVRAQLRTRLSREDCIQIVAEADNSARTIECTLASRPDVVLIDPMMRDGMGIEATRQILTRLPQTIVVVLTAFADTYQQIELRKIGVTHILNKGIESQRLIEILRGIRPAPLQTA